MKNLCWKNRPKKAWTWVSLWMCLSNITIVDSTRRSRTAVQTAVIQIFGCLLNEKSLQPLGWKSVTPRLGHGNPPHFKVVFQERVLNELIACVFCTLILDEELGIIWFCAIFPRWFNILIQPPYETTSTPEWNSNSPFTDFPSRVFLATFQN